VFVCIALRAISGKEKRVKQSTPLDRPLERIYRLMPFWGTPKKTGALLKAPVVHSKGGLKFQDLAFKVLRMG
jgi:hypothetical protein